MKALVIESACIFKSGGISSPRLVKRDRLGDVVGCVWCRTDAKLPFQGHRSAINPRIPSHETGVRDLESNALTVAWPEDA